MKVLLSCLLFCGYLFAMSADDVRLWASNKNYNKICTNGVFELASRHKDEGLMSIYADACLQTDWVNKLSNAVVLLRQTKEGRQNAVYYSTILYKKKLLYLSMIDGIDISDMILPKTNYILSDIYDAYVAKKYELKDGVYYFNLGANTYTINIINENGFDKLILKSYINDKLISTKSYW